MTELAEHDDWAALPLMLTVEEPGRLLRIGRSHTYAQTTLYFRSGGVEGIPAIRIGTVVRVPKAALHELVTTGRVVQLTGQRPERSSADKSAPNPTASTRGRRAQRTAQLTLLGSD